MIRLTTGPRGGQNYGDGWWEGQCFRCVFDAFLSTPNGCRPLNIPVSPAAVFGLFIFLGSRREKEPREDDRQARVLPDFVPLCHFDALHLVFVSPMIGSSLSRIRSDAVTSYRSDPRILNPGLFHTRFASCRILIPWVGVDENGKKGIFPSNYVRLSISGKTFG